MPVHETDYYRHADGYTVTCYVCGKEFEAERFDATFCSSTCRARQHRKLQRWSKLTNQIDDGLDELIASMPKRGSSPTMQFLQHMQRRIERAIAWVESDED